MAMCFIVSTTFCVLSERAAVMSDYSGVHGNTILKLIEKAISIPRNSPCLQHQLLLSAFSVNLQLYMGYTLCYGTLTLYEQCRQKPKNKHFVIYTSCRLGFRVVSTVVERLPLWGRFHFCTIASLRTAVF